MSKNMMEIGGYKAVITYDPEIGLFRGEFMGLNGGADFYAKDIKGLKREGAISLRVFLEACQADGVEPAKGYSGRFNVRIPPELHAHAVAAAQAAGVSLNQWIEVAIINANAEGLNAEALDALDYQAGFSTKSTRRGI